MADKRRDELDYNDPSPPQKGGLSSTATNILVFGLLAIIVLGFGAIYLHLQSMTETMNRQMDQYMAQPTHMPDMPKPTAMVMPTDKPTRTPEPSVTPKPSETPRPSETPKASATPQPSETPVVNKDCPGNLGLRFVVSGLGAQTLRLRKEPGLNADVVAILKDGDILLRQVNTPCGFLGNDAQIFWVPVRTADGKEGYVASSYLVPKNE